MLQILRRWLGAKRPQPGLIVNGIAQVCAQVQFQGVGRPNCDATVLRTADGFVWGGFVWNCSSHDRFLKLYELGREPLASDAPSMTIYVPPKSCIPLAGWVFGQNGVSNAGGVGFDHGISYRITGGPAWNDATPAAAWEVQGALWLGGL